MRDPATRKIKKYVDPIMKETLDLFKSLTETKYTVNIKFAIFGIRNLVNHAVKPRITFRMTNN